MHLRSILLLSFLPVLLAAPAAGSTNEVTIIAEFGKSVDWSASGGLIASARLGKDNYYDVITMTPDGSNVTDLTSGVRGCPQKHNGNPCFSPSGSQIVFTAENPAMDDARLEVWRTAVPGSGLGSDLYILDLGTKQAHRLTRYRLTKPLRAVIHPQFSNDGRKIAWSERVQKGESFGGGWVIKVGELTKTGKPGLVNIETIKPGKQDCFYEVHDFSPDDSKLLFSGNLQEHQPHTGLDIYEIHLKTRKLKRLTHTWDDWDEHAHYSPDGKRIAWMSSAGSKIDYGKEKGKGFTWARHLKTELWVMDRNGSNKRRLTGFNHPRSEHRVRDGKCIVSDSTWSPDGKALLFAVSILKGGNRSVKLATVRP